MTAVTLARAKPRIDDPEELERVVRRLVEAFDPLAIYLFGSRRGAMPATRATTT